MHHAYLLIGAVPWARAQIPEDDRTIGTDVALNVYERMGIDDARALIDLASRAPLTRPVRVFMIEAQGLTVEAQNALLKLFEEPSLTTRFYLIVPTADALLPTLRSRLLLLDTEAGSTELNEVTKVFLAASYAERLDMIADRAKRKDDAWMSALFAGLERYAHSTHNAAVMRDACMANAASKSAGASKKMLLEHLALSIENGIS